MEDSVRSQFVALGADADGLMDEVENALEEHAEFQTGLQVRIKVEEVSARYRSLKASLTDEKDVMEAERRWGRKIMDLHRMANRLPAPPAGKPPAEGQRSKNEFLETREGKSSNKPISIGVAPGESPRAPKAKYKVGGDCECWCGPCAELRTHTIVAMAGDEPVQVICGVCRSKHKWRSESGRGKKTAPGATGSAAGGSAAGTSARSSGNSAGDKKLDERNALLRELGNAENVRRFDPKDRYKAGEIIEHAEHGRGKIENVLRGSMLVRFPSGIRPLMLS